MKGDEPALLDLRKRPATDADAEFIFECIKRALGPHVIATYGPWDEDWQRKNFSRTTDPRSHEIIEVSARPAGCLFVEDCDACLELHRILLLPEFQNRGVGTRLIRELLSEALATRKRVRLRVFRVNPARRLYERLGFRVVGENRTHVSMEALGGT